MSKKISELTAAGALTGAEQVEVVQSGASRRTTAQDIADLASPGITNSAANNELMKSDGTNAVGSGAYGTATGIGIGTSSPDRKLHVEQESATTNAVTYVQRLTSTSSGTPSTNIGVGMDFEVETSVGNNEIGATLEVIATDVTDGSEDFAFLVKTMDSGSAPVERVRVDNTGLRVARGNIFIGSNTSVESTMTVIAQNSTGTAVLNLQSGSSVQLSPATGNVNANLSSNTAIFKIDKSTSITNTVTEVLRLQHQTSGIPANGIGAGMFFEVETSPANTEIGSSIEAVVTDVTPGSEDFDLVFKAMSAGTAAAEALRIKSDKSTVFTGPAVLPPYTVATVPSAASYTGGMIYVSDESGGAVMAFSDGTDWRRCTDRAIIS